MNNRRASDKVRGRNVTEEMLIAKSTAHESIEDRPVTAEQPLLHSKPENLHIKSRELKLNII